MLFDSFTFFVFFLTVFLLFYLVSNKYRWGVLLLGSLVFMAYISVNLVFFTLLFVVINYFVGIQLDKAEGKRRRKHIFWLGIALNVGILAFYKYINFFLENINWLLSLFPSRPEIPYLTLIVPVGISYYTFQALGYLIRINRGTDKAETHFGYFATFLVFFPKFMAGPVERSEHFLPQIKAKIEFKESNVSEGLRLFLWGLFKKVVIANNLVGPVMMVYDDVNSYSGIPLIMVMFLQTIHLYADFSGYTDMALGSAKILGINIVDNFNRPFFARNVAELWRRWHISLSSWCNDYIFTPFIVKYRKWRNKAAIVGIFLTFFVIGIWHGANWTFVILGLLQGIAISYEFYTKRRRIKIARQLPTKWVTFTSRVITFSFFSFSLIFFNSSSVHDAMYFVSHLFSNIELSVHGHDFIYEKTNFFVAIIAFLFVFLTEVYAEKGKNLIHYYLRNPRYIRWTGYYVLIVLILYFSSGEKSFVYQQF